MPVCGRTASLWTVSPTKTVFTFIISILIRTEQTQKPNLKTNDYTGTG